ncbi:MAG: hypothetical protein HQL67_11205 [Magnetococcales bacterium]|nr:hypothetical protein [Magnetococcales bacterium]
MAEIVKQQESVRSVSDLEVRVAALEQELQIMKAALYAIPNTLEKEKLVMLQNQKEVENLKNSVVKAAATSQESVQAVSNLQKKVEVVKKESTSGMVLSVIIFSILLIISLFIRST